MKVLSLTEPYATLIKEGKKKVETRSWKTSYRGELYIHASSTKVTKISKENTELMNLVTENNLNYGYIICKCNLVDCFKMTQEYVDDMKQNHYQEYVCGEYKEGRYAWVLENIEILDNPIKTKGHLSIWNYEIYIEKFEQIKDKLKKCYSIDTAHPSYKKKWNINNPTCGQCAITSVIIQEFFVGTIHRINVNGNETHYFNMINGNIVDFTKEQFDIEGIKIKYKPNELVSRDKILSNKNTKERYDILKKYLRMM